MPPEVVDPTTFSPDILEFIRVLARHDVHYVIVGGEAVVFYGHVRFTGDVDFFYDAGAENAGRLFDALQEFWSGHTPGLAGPEGLRRAGTILQYGLPPNRIDLLNTIDAVPFDTAWTHRLTVRLGTDDDAVDLHYIGLDDLIENKKAANRNKDRDDLRFLVASAEKRRHRTE